MTVETLAGWLEQEGIVPQQSAGSIADVARVRSLLIAAARAGEAMSYSQLLYELGHRFTRPKMRALCKTLDAIDRLGVAAGEPALAALVVRESDRLPGQGWWTAISAAHDYGGNWAGAEAEQFVRGIQQQAFQYWQDRR